MKMNQVQVVQIINNRLTTVTTHNITIHNINLFCVNYWIIKKYRSTGIHLIRKYTFSL